MALSNEKLIAEAEAAAPLEVENMVAVDIRKMLSNPQIVHPRHQTPTDEQKLDTTSDLNIFVRDVSCIEMPYGIYEKWPAMSSANTLAPVRAFCNDGPRLKQYLETMQKTQRPPWKHQTTFCIVGRTKYDAVAKTGGLSVTVFMPCHTSLCLELPRHMDGINLTSSEQVEAYMVELRTKLKDILLDEQSAAEADGGRSFKFKCNVGDEPTIEFEHTFAWREHANYWEPDPDDPKGLRTKRYPIVTIRAKNAWSARRITDFFDRKENKGVDVPSCPCAITAKVWETTKHIPTDMRVLCENKWPSCGWFNIKNYQSAQWTASHTDAVFGVRGPTDITPLRDDLTPAPLTNLCFDMECISSGIAQYLKLLEGNVNRFPKATDPSNSVVLICFNVNTADGRAIRVSLQLNDLPGQRVVLHKRTSFHSQGLEIEHDHFLVPNEKLMITMLRDFIVFYDPDIISSYNGDSFDWPYLFVRMHESRFDDMHRPPADCEHKRFYYLGRLLWTASWQTWTPCVPDSNSGRNGGKVKYIPVLNEKDRNNKKKTIQFRGMVNGRFGSFPGASITLALSGRTSCDVMSLIKLLGKSNKEYAFAKYNLKSVCDRLLRGKFNKLDVSLFGYWHRTDRATDPENPGQRVPPERQRERLAHYCIVDAVCPIKILEACNLIPFMELLAATTGATLHKVINAGKTAQIVPMFIKQAWETGREWVCNYTTEETRDYIGGLVIPPLPQSLAGVETPSEENLLPFESQQEPVDPEFDWTCVWIDEQTKLPISDIVREIGDLRECSCDESAQQNHLQVVNVRPDTYEPTTQTYLSTVQITLCDHVTLKRECRIPARFHNNDVIVVLDFQSLYPSIMKTDFICGSTVWRTGNYELNDAEMCEAYTRLFVRARNEGIPPGAATDTYIQQQLAQEALEREEAARKIVDTRRKQVETHSIAQTILSVDTDNLFGGCDDDDGTGSGGGGGDEDGLNGVNDDNDDETNDGCAKTGTYSQGDGDFSHESSFDPENFVSVQETTPDGQLRVHLLARPNVRRGICYQLVIIALNERARIRAEMTVILQKIKSFPKLTENMVLSRIQGLSIHEAAPKNKKEKLEQECLDFACQAIVDHLKSGSSGVSTLAELGGLVTVLASSEIVTMIKKLQELYDRMDIEQNIMKIIANSVYGILASRTKESILSNINAAACVTAQARSSLNTVRKAMNEDMKTRVRENPERYNGLEVVGVIYGDTDSVFVHLKSKRDQDTWLFLSDAAEYVNTHKPGFPFGHIRDCQLNLQAEAMMKAFNIFGPKTYTSSRDDGKVPKDYARGVATVRRDRPEVLTDLLARMFSMITKLNMYSRTVLRTMLLRMLHQNMELMMNNAIPFEKYFITQRIMRLPAGLNLSAASTSAVSTAAAAALEQEATTNALHRLFSAVKSVPKTSTAKLPQHVDVAMQICRKTGEPPRTGDSVTYVLTKAKEGSLVARPTQDVTLKDVDRMGYLCNRMQTSIARVLDVLIGRERTAEFFNMYKAALAGQAPDFFAGEASSKPSTRWERMKAWVSAPPTRERGTKRTSVELLEKTKKQIKFTKTIVKKQQTLGASLDAFFSA